ncbi:unnamed protein product, partial [marine sediment metagenome]
MAPRDCESDFMRTPLWKKAWFVLHAIVVVLAFIGLMLMIATFHFMSGIKIDHAHWDMDNVIATGRIRGI